MLPIVCVYLCRISDSLYSGCAGRHSVCVCVLHIYVYIVREEEVRFMVFELTAFPVSDYTHITRGIIT